MTLSKSYLREIASCFTPEVARRVIDWRPDPNLDGRLQYLRERANEGSLSELERAEYGEFVETLDFVGLIKAHARTMLDRQA